MDGSASWAEHTRSDALKPTRSHADANLCGEPARERPVRVLAAPAARRWRGSACTGSPGTTTTPRRGRPSKRSCRATSREFLRLAPAYGGSLVERAPFALLPGLWGGGQLAVYRMVALPCLLATAVLGRVARGADARAGALDARARGRARRVCGQPDHAARAGSRPSRGAPRRLPVRGRGAARPRSRSVATARCGPGVLLGLAIANKEWALLAVGPVLLALPAGRRRLVPAERRRLGRRGRARARSRSSPRAASSAGTRAVAAPPAAIFQPWQLWWFFGYHGALVHGPFGVPKPGYRTGPAWTGAVSHPLILRRAGPGDSGRAALWPAARRGRGC